MEMWLSEARESLLQRRSRLRARGIQGQPQVQQETSALSARDCLELRDIEDALARIQEGEFGRCLRCGGAMGRYRLRAIPEARYCLTCSALAGR